MSPSRGIAITGLGVQCALGSDLTEFTSALREGAPGVTFAPPEPDLPAALGVMARQRRTPAEVLGAHLPEVPAELRARLRPLLGRATRSKQFSLLAAVQAWTQANLPPGLDTTRTGIVIAGGNQAHRLYQEMGGKYRNAPSFVRPSYAIDLWDSDLLGTASELFGVLGEGLTTGGASAAGNVGLISGFRMVRAGHADVCLVIAPMTELSPVEQMAFFNLGALGAKQEQEPAHERSRPFDTGHDGFIYGEGAAALVLESPEHAAARRAEPLAHMLGGAVLLHGSRLSSPSQRDETRAMRRALADAGLDASQVEYVNAHATSTPQGDEAEAEALREVLGDHTPGVWVNATKGLTGHCLGAAAAIEAVACVQQMRLGFVHPNANLKKPLPSAAPLRLAPAHAVTARPRHVLSNAFGFGGINTSVVFGAAE